MLLHWLLALTMLLRCQVTWCKLISYLLLADFSIFSLSPMLEISQQWTWCVDFIINYASHSNGSFNLNTYVSQLWEYFVNQYVDNFLFILLCFVFQNPITQGLGILDWLRLTFPLIPYYLFFFSVFWIILLTLHSKLSIDIFFCWIV